MAIKREKRTMNHILKEIASKYNLKRKSGRWAGPCPKCNGSSKSDKFTIKDDGGYKCYSCDFKGDIITWLREMEGMSCPEAFQEAELDCTRTSCPVYGKCRMGDGSGSTAPRRRRALSPLPPSEKNSLPVADPSDPHPAWATWASTQVEKGMEKIKKQPAVLNWLADRGLDAIAIARFRIGWLDHDQRVDRESLQLPIKEDGKTKLWIPGGLLIPIPSPDGAVNRIRVRRTKQAMKKFLHDRKYVWIQGSGSRPLIIRPAAGEKCRGVVIIETELDAFAIAAAHHQVMVIGIGTVRGSLPADVLEEIASLATILVALDADPQKAGKQGAGPAAAATWLGQFRHARYWPVPTGKDPGEYAAAGGSLFDWIEAGLIPEITSPPASSSQDLPISPDCHQQGGAGCEEISPEKNMKGESRIITLKDGREFHVTESQELWNQLVAEEKTVFSENELLRLQAACAECDAEGAKSLANAVLDLKEVFSGAYIKRGGKKIDHYGYQMVESTPSEPPG